jgi:dCTP deaminase
VILPSQAIERSLLIFPCEGKKVINGMSAGLSSAGYDICVREDIHLHPFKRFSLASSLEYFSMPLDVLGVVHDKSSWARKGVAVQNTIIEPAWRGYLTLEISLNSFRWIHIKEGSPIAQIIFHRLEAPTDLPYRGKYNDQPAYPVKAITEK